MPRRHCIVCHQDVEAWIPFMLKEEDISTFLRRVVITGSNILRFECPNCHAIDRERHLMLFFQRLGIFENKMTGCEILHIAPEPVLTRYFETLSPARHVRGDLLSTNPDVQRMDIESLPFPAASFDLVVFNHVLEHVADFRKALHEVARVTKAGGRIICQTPFAAKMTTTLEDPLLQSAQDRLYFYAQDDHVRLFGLDIEQFISDAGFSGRLIAHDELLPDIDPEAYGVNELEPFFDFIKSDRRTWWPAWTRHYRRADAARSSAIHRDV